MVQTIYDVGIIKKRIFASKIQLFIMSQIIDIEEEKTLLWSKVYCSLIDILKKKNGCYADIDIHMSGDSFLSVNLDSDGILLLKDSNGNYHFIEEYDDDLLFLIYETIVSEL